MSLFFEVKETQFSLAHTKHKARRLLAILGTDKMVLPKIRVKIVFDDIKIVNDSYALYGVNVKIQRFDQNEVEQTFEQHVFRRYSEFWELKNNLEKEFKSELPYELPNRGFGLWTKSGLSPEVIESRKVKLAQFLTDMLNDSFDTKWKNSNSVSSFLKLPKGWNSNEIGNTGGALSRNSDNRKLDLKDPAQWLVGFRDAKTLLSEGKQISHSGNTKILMQLRLSLYHLENALENTRRSELLTESEASRREGLLQSLKSDINEMALHSNSSDEDNPFLETQNDKYGLNNIKSSLFKTASGVRSPKKPLVGRRKLGETEETLQLNNEQLLQLHKDRMTEQDKELEQMRKIIQRQKTLSIEMNQELSQQNDLLDLLGSDIDNTSSKLRVANRKAKQFNNG